MAEYQSFSHPHSMRIYGAEPSDKIHCAGCELPTSGPVYGCKPCNYFLHKKCADTSRMIQHSAHPDHHLTLMPKPTYFKGSFTCNACGDSGSAFSLSCAACDFDLHLTCADLPLTIDHKAHPHPLTLTYELKLDEASAFICDVCDKHLDHKRWIYYCAACEFGAHLHCASPEARPPPRSESIGEQASQQIEDPIVKAHREMLQIQLQLKMAQEFSQMMSSWNPSSFI